MKRLAPTTGAKGLLALALGSLLLHFPAANAGAQIFSLTDGASSIDINVGSQAGMYNWTIDGQDQLNQQWFWFRIGNSGLQSSIDSISSVSVSQPTSSSLIATYTHSLFTIQTTYTLAGGAAGSGNSGLAEQISIINTSGGTLDFHFFEYADFASGGAVQLGQDVTHTILNEAYIQGGPFNILETIDTSVAPGANHGEAAAYPGTLTALNGTPGYTLNDIHSAGPGDATWALEWDRTLTNNATLLISKNLSIEAVPEPSTWALGLIGLLALGVGRAFSGRRRMQNAAN